jgi:phage host-nuclease inhibitor protein Gam
MARKPLPGTHFTTWDDVDQALARIGAIDRDLGLIESSANERIDAIKAQAKEDAAQLTVEKASLEAHMKAYAEAHRADLNGKSRQLTFGKVGFRQSTRIVIKRVVETIRLLADFGLDHCLRIKTEPDKDAMSGLSDEELQSVGAVRKVDDVFGYEVHQQELAENTQA